MSESDTLLKFPCKFPIKMMGRAVDGFDATAIGLIERHVGSLAEDRVVTSESRNGNFVSVTVTIDAENQQQLDSIYQDLTDHADILVAL